MAVGVIYTELDLDMSKFVAKQKSLLKQIEAVGKDSELALQRSFMNLGVQSDMVYKLMVEKARVSYERIAQSGKTSADEQYRAQSAMVAKINSLNMEMARNPLYETIGIRSVAAINAQKAAVIASYDTIKSSGTATAQDIVNIERAKNAKLKELNKEMVGQHDMSMAAMMRAILRFYAAYYVISNVIRTITDTIMGGVKAIDNMKISVIGVAAQITTMQGTTGDIVENYKNNLLYAKALVPVLMQIDASSFANLSQIQRMNTAMTLQGTILDVNNKKQLEAFTALSNAVALFTQGQDKERQAAQEIRALFTGQVRAGNQVALMMDGLIRKQGEYRDGLKGLIAEGNKHGDTLERMMPYLSGIIAASGDISMTWEAVSSSLETSWNIIQRRLFSGIYEDMTKAGREFADWLRNEDSSLHQFVKRLEEIKVGIESLINLIPEGVGGPVTYGILGRLLFGSTPVGVFITALTLSKDMLDRLGVAAWKARTEAEWAAAAIAVMAKQSGMFGGGEAGKPSGAGREFALETPKVISSAIDEEALKDAYDFLKLKEDAETEYLKNIAKAYLDKYKNDEKLRKEGEMIFKKGLDDRKKAEKEVTDAAMKAADESMAAMKEQIALGLKWGAQPLEDAKAAADEAAKQVELYKGLAGFEDEYRKKQLDWIEKVRLAEIAAGMDKEAVNKRASDAVIKIAQAEFDAKAKQIQQGLGDMSSMFTSLSGMYDKNSGEYARLQEAANAMIVLQKAVAVVNAVSAVAASAAAPFPAGFVAMASMAAAMGSLLGSIGVSFGGGSVSAPSAAYGIGTTTFGGENYSGSESISKTWELLEDTYDLEKVTLTGIYENMKQLNANITGIVRGIVSGDMGNMTIGQIGTSESSLAKYAVAAAAVFSWTGLGVVIFDKIFGTNISGKITNFLFGSSTTTATASGIMVGGGGVSPYTQTRTETSGFLGGLFGGGGSSESRAIGAIDATLTNLFYGEYGIYTTLKKTVSEMAVILGTDVARAENKVFEAFELNFIGKTPEEIEKIVSRKISEIGDKFASEVFGDLIRTYQQVGEGALETASRLAIDLLSVTDILGMTGKTIVSVSIELSESLIEIAGSLDKLSEAASTYYDKFFSDEEKHLRLQGILTEAMNQMNLPLMENRMGYRALVEAFDLTVDWQKEAYVSMLKWAEAADTYYSTLEETMEEAIKTNEDYIQSLKNISLTIQAWLDNLRISDLAPVQSAAEWNRQYLEAKSKASLSGATEKDVSDYLNFASKYLGFQQSYGTSGSYQAIYDAVVGDVEGMQKGKNEALDLAQKQLDELKLIKTNTGDTATNTDARSAIAGVEYSKGWAEAYDRFKLTPDYQTYLTAETSGGYAELPGYQTFLKEIGWVQEKYNAFVAWDRPHASGGYSDRPAIFGESGGEWAVPTYEPQRSNFLKKAPAKFWDNLGLNGGTNGPVGESTIHNHIYIDGKEIQYVVSRGMKSNPDLIASTRRAVN